MTNNASDVLELLQRHYAEAADGLVDRPPSQLRRGEGTEKNFFIMKIDLVGSTQLLLSRRKSTYLKLAHTYLSTIDSITQSYGADPNQVEYAGDSVIAYFEESSTSAENVISAACYSKSAVDQIKNLDTTLKSLQLKCKVVLHYASLIVSKIGPRANSITTAIGHPIHRVAKIEKDISPNIGRATPEFYQKVYVRNRRFLQEVATERKIPVNKPSNSLASINLGLGALGASNFGMFHQPAPQNILSLLANPPPPPPITEPQYEIEKTIIGYNLKWIMLFKELGLF